MSIPKCFSSSLDQGFMSVMLSGLLCFCPLMKAWAIQENSGANNSVLTIGMLNQASAKEWTREFLDSHNWKISSVSTETPSTASYSVRPDQSKSLQQTMSEIVELFRRSWITEIKWIHGDLPAPRSRIFRIFPPASLDKSKLAGVLSTLHARGFEVSSLHILPPAEIQVRGENSGLLRSLLTDLSLADHANWRFSEDRLMTSNQEPPTSSAFEVENLKFEGDSDFTSPDSDAESIESRFPLLDERTIYLDLSPSSAAELNLDHSFFSGASPLRDLESQTFKSLDSLSHELFARGVNVIGYELDIEQGGASSSLIRIHLGSPRQQAQATTALHEAMKFAPLNFRTSRIFEIRPKSLPPKSANANATTKSKPFSMGQFSGHNSCRMLRTSLLE